MGSKQAMRLGFCQYCSPFQPTSWWVNSVQHVFVESQKEIRNIDLYTVFRIRDMLWFELLLLIQSEKSLPIQDSGRILPILFHFIIP